MPLTGEINDLSLSEVIELFCNRRKTGRLTVVYPQGTAQFYLKPGAIVHAAFENLQGTEAVHFALTLPNASFTFQPDVEAPERSIDEPWTSVVLDGLRKIDEGVLPIKPATNGNHKMHVRYEQADRVAQTVASDESGDDVQSFGVLLSQMPESAPPRRWLNVPVLIAIVLIVLGIGVPWGWYTRHKATQIRGESDDQKFEHLYTRTEPSPQPSAAPEQNSEKRNGSEGEKPSQPENANNSDKSQ